MNYSEIISIVEIFVNVLLTIWIISVLQKNLNNERVLKNHFIEEIKLIREDYRRQMTSLYSNSTHSTKITPWFKLMNIKVNDLMLLIEKKYNVDKSILLPYQQDLRELITNNEDFIESYSKKGKVVFSNASKNSLIVFQQKHNKLFNKIILGINDYTSGYFSKLF